MLKHKIFQFVTAVLEYCRKRRLRFLLHMYRPSYEEPDKIQLVFLNHVVFTQRSSMFEHKYQYYFIENRVQMMWSEGVGRSIMYSLCNSHMI